MAGQSTECRLHTPAAQERPISQPPAGGWGYLAPAMGLDGFGRYREPVAAEALPRVRAKDTYDACVAGLRRVWPNLADMMPVLPSCA